MTHRILEISTLSTRDYIYITANYLSLLRGDKDTTETLRERGYSEEQIRIARTHKTVSEIKMYGLKFSRDLTEFKFPLMYYLLILTENYERGLLPFPGTVTEQPAQIMEILNHMLNVKMSFKNEVHQKQVEAANRSAKR